MDQHIINEIKKKREDAGLTQEALSERLGFNSNGFVGQVESARSEKKYNSNHINKAALIFGCSPKDFLPEVPFAENKVILPLRTRRRQQDDDLEAE